MSPVPSDGRVPRGRTSRRASLTIWSLAALAAGLILGICGHVSGHAAFSALADAVRPIGDLWVAALQMTVLPLVIAYTVAAVVGVGVEASVGPLAGRALLLFLAMLAAVGLLTIALAPLLVRFFPAGPAVIAAMNPETSVSVPAREAAGAEPGSLADRLGMLLPRNLFEAAARGDILPILLFAVLFGIAITRLPAEQREPLGRVFQGAAAATLMCVRWILALIPVGVFALIYRFALGAGGRAAGVLGAWVVVVSTLLLLCTVLLYPVTAWLGRTRLRAFAHAVSPAQAVAVSTRSSIASLPALIEGAREGLRLPERTAGLVLPLSVSLFKINRPVSSTAKLIFLAHVYGIPLTAATLAGFLVTVMILSFSTLGLPSGGTSLKTLPAYLAAGLPVEGVVILEAVETIPDIFKTLLNVTGDMSAATLLSRSSRRAPDAAPAAGKTRPARETA